MSATAASGAPTRQARLARAAVATLFLTNGAVFFNVVPRYPELKADLGLSNAVFGTALAGYPIGALLAGLLAAAAIRRFGSGRVAAFGIVITTLVTLAIPAAPQWIAFAAVLFVVGASTRSSTSRRTRTACGSSASMAGPSSTRCTASGASARCSAA